MSGRLIALLAVIIGFGALTAVALMDAGVSGIIKPHFQSWGGAQVFVDLVILAVLGCGWMRHDGRVRGLPAWPFILATPFTGSFGLLFYLLMRELRQTQREAVAA